MQPVKRDASVSGNEIHARGFGLRGFDAVLIQLDRCSVCVGSLVCDEPDFRLTNDDMGRVCGTYVAHMTSLLEFLYFAGIRSWFLKRFG
jgi:hypothetical protein